MLICFSFFVDPIPAGLMEECLDWDVEVKAAVHTNGLASAPSQPLRKHLQKIERTPQTQKAHGNHLASCRNTSVSTLSVKSKNTTKPKLPVKSHSECGILEKAESPKAPGRVVQLEGQEQHSAETPAESSTSEPPAKEDPALSLPQIPCLSSFKTHPPCALTFAELLEDYEHYIKEGLEKPVEIIRHYTGPGERAGNPHNGFVRNGVPEERVRVLASSSQSGDSESDSDSYSSRTSSQSKGNKSYVEGSSDIQLKDLASTPVADHTYLEQPLNGNDTPNLEEYQESPETQTKARHKEGASQRARQSRRNPRRSTCRLQTEPQEDEWSDRQWDAPAGFSGTYQDYEEYWRAYYRAWHEYYSASQSYYWNAQRHPGWMAAYHMNTIYLQEMMRGSQ